MNKTHDIPTNYTKDDHLVTLNDVWDNPISIFANIKSTNPEHLNLKHWLMNCIKPSNYYFESQMNDVLKYRENGGKSIKMNLPVFCPGAILKSRKKDDIDKIQQLTGWMQFDIDLKDNPLITNAAALRDQVKNIAYVAFCSLSVSGKGAWGLIKVQHNDRYKEHFEQLKIDFASRGIKLDPSKGGNPTDLRIYSYDPEAYLAKQFKVYNRLLSAQKKRIIQMSQTNCTATRADVEGLIKQLNKKQIDITPDYESYRNVGFALANEFGESGRNLYHAICCINVQYKEKETDNQYTSCLKSGGKGITIATFFFLCKQKGVIKKYKPK